MRFFLMQRNHQVAVIEIAEKTGDIIDVAEVLSAQRIPLGAKHSDGSFDVLSLRKWWAGRGIPASRSGLEHALETLHIPYAELLLVKSPLESAMTHSQCLVRGKRSTGCTFSA